MIEQTYEIEKNPSPPMQWEEYKARLSTSWPTFLNSEAAQEEKNVQGFLEEHPCLIPGAFGTKFSSGHFPFPCGVITQPVLKGLTTKVPDFMWIAADSGSIYPTLVEIEAPHKRWFTQGGNPHSDLTQAQGQLASWKAWFNIPVNQQLFLEYYKIPSGLVFSRRLHPLFILVYGRREEFKDAPRLNSLRANLERQDETLMSYDRLEPEEKAKNMMCVRLVESTTGLRYQALRIPPTYTLGPLEAEYRALVSEKEEAVNTNSLISPERREFLIRRIPYWDEWVRKRSGGYSFNAGDKE